MKTRKSLFAFGMALMLLPGALPVKAQITHDINTLKLPGDGVALYMSGSTDTTATLTSSPFTLANYDNESFKTYPIVYSLKLTGTSLSTKGISVFVQGSNFREGTYTPVDTASYSDSAATEIRKTLDLNNLKYVFYKIVVRGEAKNTKTAWDLCLYPYRKDPY